MSREDVSMDKVAADMDKALEVAAKKDDVYYNRAKIIYNYALGKPEKVYKDWSLDKRLGRGTESDRPLTSFRFMSNWRVTSSLPSRTIRRHLPAMIK